MKYDFIEIGTSDFDTLIQQGSDELVGLSIEPIKHYLDALPNRPHVKKINCAVSRSNLYETLEVFYLPESVLVENDLPGWLRGCNSVGDYHYQHKILNVTHLVKTQQVPCVPIADILEQNQVTEIDFLKIDTEGSDSQILTHFYEYIKDRDRAIFPKRILFESNILNDPTLVTDVKNKFVSLGYRIDTVTPEDTVLVLD